MIHGMCLIRNEANNRWLNEYTKQMFDLCDTMTFLDDNSTDDTIQEICILHSNIENKPKLKIINNESCMWETNEVEARKKLFDEVVTECKHGDWIICLDADEIIPNEYMNYLKYCLNYLYQYPVESYDGMAFRLFDMWDDKHYRFDKWWTGHLRPWCFAIRYDKKRSYEWSDKKLHCGRFPQNASLKCRDTLTPVKHMGWSREEFRKLKYDKYMEIDSNKQDGLIEQYYSILDKNPNLIKF